MDLTPDIPLPLPDPLPSWHARLRVAAGGTIRSLEPGQVLVREGERPSCFWTIQSGAIALAYSTPWGRRATVAVLGRGSVLGEQGLSRRAVLADLDPMSLPEGRALVASTVCSIPLPALRLAMATDRRVARWVVVAVGRRASQVQRTLARTLGMRVPCRLLGVLRDLAADHGRFQAGYVNIRIPLTQDLLASMVGASRESVNRALADLGESGLVRRIGSRYAVALPPAGSEGGSP